MKITEVRAYPLASPLDTPLRWGTMVVNLKGGIVVEVHTDDGLIGLGEAGFSAEYFPTVGPIVNGQLGPMLVGRDPLEIEARWQEMIDATHMWGRRGIETYAVSGIDIALWDLLGRVTDQPVHRLLGTAQRRARAYFAPSLKATEATVAECARAVDNGFTAMKLRAYPSLRDTVEMVSEVRSAVGNAQLMVDANMQFDRRDALVLARELEGLDVYWLEEPIHTRSLPQYVDDHAWLADRVSLRLAGGESLLTRYEYIPLLERKVFDVLQPDATSVGGLSEMKRVADLAGTWNLECVPHIACSSGTGIALAAGLHGILAAANAPLVEVDAYGGPGWDGLLVDPLVVKEGYLEARETPGLGVELASHAHEHFAVTS